MVRHILSTVISPIVGATSLRPETLKAIGIKAAVQHWRAYDKIMRSSYTVAPPGPCTTDITTWPFKRLRPGIFSFTV